MDNNTLPEDELATKEIATLEGMNEMLKTDTEAVQAARVDTATEAVEKSLSSFVRDAFASTKSDFEFKEQLNMEFLRRLPNLTDNQFIAGYSNFNTILNDRVSKIIAPTFGMMQTKQTAEIAAAKQQAQNQIIVAPQGGQGGSLNAQIDGEAGDVAAILQGADVMSKLISAMGDLQITEEEKH